MNWLNAVPVAGAVCGYLSEALRVRPSRPKMGASRRSSSVPRVGQGLSNKDIAYTLSISDRTVRHHMTSIFDKGSVPKRQKLLIRVHHVCSTPI